MRTKYVKQQQNFDEEEKQHKEKSSLRNGIKMAKPVFHAFIDESGDPHFSSGASDTFLICATLIREGDISEIEDKLKALLEKI